MNISIIVSISSLVLCVLMYLYFKWYIKRRTNTDHLLSQYRSEVHRLIAEINVITDRDSRLVEERIKNLKSILDNTDKRINIYMSQLESGSKLQSDKERNNEGLYTSLGRGIRAALNTTEQPVSREPALTAAQPKQVTPSTMPTMQAKPGAATPPTMKASEPQKTALPLVPETKKELRIQIAELAAKGLSHSEIASRLDISLSEVDLALNLYGS